LIVQDSIDIKKYIAIKPNIEIMAFDLQIKYLEYKITLEDGKTLISSLSCFDVGLTKVHAEEKCQ